MCYILSGHYTYVYHTCTISIRDIDRCAYTQIYRRYSIRGLFFSLVTALECEIVGMKNLFAHLILIPLSLLRW